MTFDEWIAENEPNPPTGFECIGVERMRQVWDASAKAEREACAKVCDELATQRGYCDGPGPKACARHIRQRSNAKSQATDAALSRQVACTDGLGVAVPPAPTFGGTGK